MKQNQEITVKILIFIMVLFLLIYQHKENRSIVYCENDQGDETRDFKKIGEGQVRCDLVSRCSFAK